MRRENVLLLLFVLSTHCNNEKNIEHLVNIIKSETSRAYNVPPITNSYEFIPKSTSYIDYGTFDHIIVGGGTAGGVIANRLSEDNFRQILVIEAGGMPTEFSNIPAFMHYLTGLEMDWNYFTIPQNTSCLGMNTRQCAISRGKLLGGSSSVNALIYARGNKRDYDNWGLEGWSFEEVLPLFKKFEKYTGRRSPYRGNSGELNIDNYETINIQADAFLDANKLLGREELDYNGERQIGCGKTQFMTLKGERHSVAKAFIEPILGKRSNLQVLTNTLAIKILIKKKRAFGILFSKNGKLYVAKSRQDIIISAGSINSPQLLMLSGIGPQQHLEEMGIPVIENLPVGENVEDHPTYPYLEFSTNFTQPQYTLEKLVDGYLKNDGSLSCAFNIQTLAFLQTNLTTISDYPDVELLMVPSINGDSTGGKFWNLNEETMKVVSHDDRQNSFYVLLFVLHPKSRGTIRLKSANPFHYPLIHLNFLSDIENTDIETMYEGIQEILKLTSTDPFLKLDTKLRDNTLPACKKFDYLSKDYWYCQIRQLTTSIFHPISSCKMGSSPDVGAVVDPELKIFGVENLRVADSSVIPTSISGHTTAATIMIGEKAAEFIRSSD